MITQQQLRELAHYCPETGQFTHLQSKGRKKSGMPAGSLRRDGYIYVMFNGFRAMAHQLGLVTADKPENDPCIDKLKDALKAYDAAKTAGET